MSNVMNETVVLATTIGNYVRTQRDATNAKIGDLASLTTTEKTSIVLAVNEAVSRINASGNASIVDTETSPTSTWSSTKISLEIDNAVSAIDTGAIINDTATDVNAVWSASKVMAAIEAARQDVLDDNITRTNALIDQAPSILDTFAEVATALGNDPNFATTVLSDLSNRLRVDVANQTLTTQQRTNGRANLAVYSSAEVDAKIGDTSIDLSAVFLSVVN